LKLVYLNKTSLKPPLILYSLRSFALHNSIDLRAHSCQTLFKNLPVSHLSVNIQSPPSGIGLKPTSVVVQTWYHILHTHRTYFNRVGIWRRSQDSACFFSTTGGFTSLSKKQLLRDMKTPPHINKLATPLGHLPSQDHLCGGSDQRLSTTQRKYVQSTFSGIVGVNIAASKFVLHSCVKFLIGSHLLLGVDRGTD
jgi:hypothetical protein